MALNTNSIKKDAVEQRRKFAVAWNQTMIQIWKERIQKLGVIDTGVLFRSLLATKVSADADFLKVYEEEMFLEYGIWQDLGTGRETPIGNMGDIGHAKVRQRRRWFSTKYYGSTMAIKEFMAESIGIEFIGLVAAGLDTDELRKNTNHYKRLGF